MALDSIARGIALSTKNSIGQPNGIASLNDAGKVPEEQLPSYIDDVREYNSFTDFPSPGESGVIYIAKDTNTSYRWTGTQYVVISSNNYNSLSNKPQVNSVELAGNKTSADLGLQSTLVSGTSIKTVNDTSLLGSGNIAIETYQPFPSTWVKSGTLEQVVASMLDDPVYAKQGMAYLGGIEGNCTPFGYGNAECTVTFLLDYIAVLSVSSSNVSPYHWEYNTASGDFIWRKYTDVVANTTTTPDHNLTKLSLDGTHYYVTGSMGQTFTTTTTVGGITSGTQILATDSLADILYRILAPTPPTPSGTPFAVGDTVSTVYFDTSATPNLSDLTYNDMGFGFLLTNLDNMVGLVSNNALKQELGEGYYLSTLDGTSIFYATHAIPSIGITTPGWQASATSGSYTFSNSFTNTTMGSDSGWNGVWVSKTAF